MKEASWQKRLETFPSATENTLKKPSYKSPIKRVLDTCWKVLGPLLLCFVSHWLFQQLGLLHHSPPYFIDKKLEAHTGPQHVTPGLHWLWTWDLVFTEPAYGSTAHRTFQFSSGVQVSQWLNGDQWNRGILRLMRSSLASWLALEP